MVLPGTTFPKARCQSRHFLGGLTARHPSFKITAPSHRAELSWKSISTVCIPVLAGMHVKVMIEVQMMFQGQGLYARHMIDYRHHFGDIQWGDVSV